MEPTAELSNPAIALHRAASIEWVDDSLPELASLAEGRRFDLVMITAMWMHLDEKERATAMPRVASLVRPEGKRLKAGGRVSTCSNMAKLGVAEDVLSARLIVSSLLSERAPRQLLNSRLFIDVGVVCGIGWNGAQV